MRAEKNEKINGIYCFFFGGGGKMKRTDQPLTRLLLRKKKKYNMPTFKVFYLFCLRLS